MAGSNDWIMSLSRCEKLMAARIVNTVPSATCFFGSTCRTLALMTSFNYPFIEAEGARNQFVGAAAGFMTVEDVDDQDFLRFVVAGERPRWLRARGRASR